MNHAPGSIRDAIVGFLSVLRTDATIAEIYKAVSVDLGNVPSSSVRSYLNNNIPDTFERAGRGRYRLTAMEPVPVARSLTFVPALQFEKSNLYQADCFDWLEQQKPNSVQAVVTDPSYGLVEYSPYEQAKLLNGKGGVWRIPPAFDGHQRSPLPRFTTLDCDDRAALYIFFKRLGTLLRRVVVHGGNILVASNPLLAHIVASAMSDAGLELRGSIVRQVMTMRGGDRPKNAHLEFPEVSVMPRSMWEPWVMLRCPLDGTAAENLRKWKTGGFRRISEEKPFCDMIKSAPTSKVERKMAPHPSLKPQVFLREVVRAVLPLGEGVILDPFAGSGSTLAAANAVGLNSIGIESDPRYVQIAQQAIPKLSSFTSKNPVSPKFLDAAPVKSSRSRSQNPSRVASKVGNSHLR